jgi:hypothetical protein
MSRIKPKFLPVHKETWTTGTSLSVTHGLSSTDVIVQIVDQNTGAILNAMTGWGDSGVEVTITDSSTVDLVATTAPTGSGYRVMVLSI